MLSNSELKFKDYKLDKSLNEKGCLNLGLGVIESAFTHTRKEKNRGWLNERKYIIYRREALKFLKSPFVQVVCDCSNNLEQGKLIKLFKEEFYNK